MYKTSLNISVQLKCTTTVSSDSWVSRTQLIDQGLGVLIRDDSNRLLVVSVADLVAPGREVMAARGEASGGPSADSSKVTMTQLQVGLLRAGGGMVFHKIVRPKIVHPEGLSTAAIIVPEGSSLAKAVLNGESSAVLNEGQISSLPLAQESNQRFVASADLSGVVGFDSFYPGPEHSEDGPWRLSRRGLVASDPSGGFGGSDDTVALDIAATCDQQGAAVSLAGNPSICIGVLRCLPDGQGAVDGQGAMVLGTSILSAVKAASGSLANAT